MEAIAYAVSGGWASGISAYGTVLVLGLLGRTGLADTPEALQRSDVLVTVGALAAIELVADKIPYVDSLWDIVHTVVRPLVASVVAVLGVTAAPAMEQAAVAALAGSIALLTHGAKTSLRLAVNSTPGAVTNAGVSAVEDIAVVGVLLLATVRPWPAATAALIFLAIGLSLAAWTFSRSLEGLRRLWQRYFDESSSSVPR